VFAVPPAVAPAGGGAALLRSSSASGFLTASSAKLAAALGEDGAPAGSSGVGAGVAGAAVEAAATAQAVTAGMVGGVGAMRMATLAEDDESNNEEAAPTKAEVAAGAEAPVEGVADLSSTVDNSAGLQWTERDKQEEGPRRGEGGAEWREYGAVFGFPGSHPRTHALDGTESTSAADSSVSSASSCASATAPEGTPGRAITSSHEQVLSSGESLQSGTQATAPGPPEGKRAGGKKARRKRHRHHRRRHQGLSWVILVDRCLDGHTRTLSR